LQINICPLPDLNIKLDSFQILDFQFEHWMCWDFWLLQYMVSSLNRNCHQLYSLNLQWWFTIFTSRIWKLMEELLNLSCLCQLSQGMIFLGRFFDILRYYTLCFFLQEPIILLIRSSKVYMPLFAFFKGLSILQLFALDWFLQKWHMIFHL
jgi:hypothetical protein